MGHSLDEKFHAAVEIVQNMPKEGPVKTSTDEKLVLYGLFKQATIGPCNVGRPAFWNVVEKYKWDAWHALGDMDSTRAKEEYVEGLQKMIDKTCSKYDFRQWLVGDDFDRLEPILRRNFAIIDREMVKADGNERDSDKDKPVEIEKPVVEPLSDNEYMDAVDAHSRDDSASRSRSSSFEMEETRSARRVGSTKETCLRLERELRNISGQVAKLTEAFEQRHNTLLSIFKKATVYMFVPKGVSWKTVFFFIVWPFVVHFFLRYYKRYF